MRTIALTLAVGVGALVAPAAQAAIPAGVSELKKEPTVREVQRAALRYFKINKGAVDSMMARAANKAWAPVLTVSTGYAQSDVDDTTFNNEFATDRPWVLRGVDGDALEVRAKASWNLPQLIFNSEELDVASLAGSTESLLKNITGLYFERRRLQVEMLLKPSDDASTKITQELRLEELTSLIDGMTGGWFGRELAKLNGQAQG